MGKQTTPTYRHIYVSFNGKWRIKQICMGQADDTDVSSHMSHLMVNGKCIVV